MISPDQSLMASTFRSPPTCKPSSDTRPRGRIAASIVAEGSTGRVAVVGPAYTPPVVFGLPAETFSTELVAMSIYLQKEELPLGIFEVGVRLIPVALSVCIFGVVFRDPSRSDPPVYVIIRNFLLDMTEVRVCDFHKVSPAVNICTANWYRGIPEPSG